MVHDAVKADAGQYETRAELRWNRRVALFERERVLHDSDEHEGGGQCQASVNAVGDFDHEQFHHLLSDFEDDEEPGDDVKVVEEASRVVVQPIVGEAHKQAQRYGEEVQLDAADPQRHFRRLQNFLKHHVAHAVAENRRGDREMR